MPDSDNTFQEALGQIMEVIMFENWLRFYFIADKAGDNENAGEELFLELPEKTLQKIKELYPQLYPLAAGLNGRPIDFERSRQAVMDFVMRQLDGKTLARGMAQDVFNSQLFQKDLQLFHVWEQLHEDQLDQGFADFSAWRALFAQWKKEIYAREAQLKKQSPPEKEPEGD